MNHLALDNVEFVKRTTDVNNFLTSLKSSRIDSFFLNRDIVNIADSIKEKLRRREKFFSVELFLSKKYDEDVYKRFISEVGGISSPPLFYVTTWHEGPSRDTHSRNQLLTILKTFPSNTLLHVAVNNSKEDEISKILDDALQQGKTNVFALRGDHCTGNGDFRHAVDLVKFIRANYGNKFVIGVAGYPEMHPESVSRKIDIFYLKEKVDAGANFIITQIFLKTKVFVDFVDDCKKSGIKIPIIPGIFPIQSFKSLVRMSKFCSFKIPREILNDLEPIKDDDEKVYEYGISLAKKLIREILACEAASGFHLFTLNRSSVVLDVCRDIFN